MTDTSHTNTPAKILLDDEVRFETPSPDLLNKVKRQTGLGAIRQNIPFLRLKNGPGQMDIVTYYGCRVYDPALSMTEKRAFVGIAGNKAFNRAMGNVTQTVAQLNSKIAMEKHMRAEGLPVVETQAVFSREASDGQVRHLGSAGEIVEFLRNDAVYPLFLKPNAGTRSGGSLLADSVDSGENTILASGGRKIPLEALAAEIASDHADGGFLFQTALRQNETARGLAGDTISTLRVVISRRDDAIVPLYVLWKLAAPSATSDNFWQAGSMLALIDQEKETIARVCRGSGPDREEVETHPVTGAPLIGATVPALAEAVDLAKRAFDSYSDIGIIGFDVALAEGGPRIVEANSNPFNILYQLVSGRGVLELTGGMPG